MMLLRGINMLIKETPILKLNIDETNSEEFGYNQEKSVQTVEVELLPPVAINDKRKVEIYKSIADIDKKLDFISERVNELNLQIDSLTNHADGIDYAIAVTSGIITGIIDSIFVGKWDFEKAKLITEQDINGKVAEFVKKDPRYIDWCKNAAYGRKERDPNCLETAIEFLEEKYHLPGDGAYMTGNYGITGNTHRLDDFCHHPTLIGMLCSIVVQFTGETIYSHDAGNIVKIPIGVNCYGKLTGNNPITKVMAGVINWFLTCAKAISNQKGHLMSDIATSAGVPGSLLSTLKELSSLPCFKDKNFFENLSKAYQHGIGNGENQVDLGFFNQLFEGAYSKFDKRTETAITHELKRQAVPVIVGEALVRGFYFIRRFIEQMKIKNSISEINWKIVLPFKNRTVVRMLTISASTFMALDIADAAIRSGGFNASCILRINFVGIGRFAVAVGTDIGMEFKKRRKERERSEVLSEYIKFANIKMYYRKADMLCSEAEMYEQEAKMHAAEKEVWQEVQYSEDIMKQLYEQINKTCRYYAKCVDEMDACLGDIGLLMPNVDKVNPGLREMMLERLK